MNKTKQWLRYKLNAMSHFKEARKHGIGLHAPTHATYFEDLHSHKVEMLKSACEAMRNPIKAKLDYKISSKRAMEFWQYKLNHSIKNRPADPIKFKMNGITSDSFILDDDNVTQQLESFSKKRKRRQQDYYNKFGVRL